MTRPTAIPRVLGQRFYARPTLEVARDLLGKVMVRRAPDGTTAGVVVEAEAYIGEADPACHAAPGPTERNAPLYGPPGHAYVYFNYGMHWLVNAVTEPAGTPAAVLIRALDPVEGLDLMRARRGLMKSGRPIPDHALCRGPGNVARAMGIGGADNRADLTRPCRGARAGESGPALWFEDRGILVPDVTWTPRIGISVGVDAQWRCVVTRHPAVSKTRRAVGVTRGGGAPDAERGRGTRLSDPRGRPRS